MSIRHEIKDFDDLDISDDGTEIEVLFSHNHNGNQYVDIPIEMIVELLERHNAKKEAKPRIWTMHKRESKP